MFDVKACLSVLRGAADGSAATLAAGFREETARLLEEQAGRAAQAEADLAIERWRTASLRRDVAALLAVAQAKGCPAGVSPVLWAAERLRGAAAPAVEDRTTFEEGPA